MALDSPPSRPGHGTDGSAVWAICDLQMYQARAVKTEVVVAFAAMLNLDMEPDLIKVHISRWRTAHGFGKVAQIERNGYKHPRPGTDGHAIWSWANKLSNFRDYKALRAEILSSAETQGFKRSNVATELSAWHSFHKGA